MLDVAAATGVGELNSKMSSLMGMDELMGETAEISFRRRLNSKWKEQGRRNTAVQLD